MNLLLETYGSDSSSDDEDFVVRAPTPRTTVNGRTHAHLPNLLSYYLLTNPDFAPTERPAKKAKTVVPKVKFADLREDVRANAIQTMPVHVLCVGVVLFFSPHDLAIIFFVSLMTSFFYKFFLLFPFIFLLLSLLHPLTIWYP